MRLATLSVWGDIRAARIDSDGATLLPYASVDALLAAADWRASAADYSGQKISFDDCWPIRLVQSPSKVVCTGLNYKTHIQEMGRALPEHPTLFAKFADSLTGPFDPIVLPPESDQVDWEVELAVVVGRRARRVSTAEAGDAIAGFTIANDVSMRDWQYRTTEWLQGKAFEGATPIGPVLITREELNLTSRVQCKVNDEVVQDAMIDDLLFSPTDLVSYISTFTTLNPGDVILTGTPGGVGYARDPKRFLKTGDVLESTITGIGVCRNEIVDAIPGDRGENRLRGVWL